MSINIKNGELSKTIRSAGAKLVAIDFSNEGCPPCRQIHPFWESLVPQYPTVVFCTVMCSECPTDAGQYNVSATPTFVFIRNGQELERFSGADKNKIKQCLEKHKSQFSGSGHSIGQPMNTEDFFASLQKKKTDPTAPPEAAAPPPKPSPISPAHPPPPSQPPKELEAPQDLIDNLIEMGFETEEIKKAYRATRGGDLDAILQYFETVQTKGEYNPPAAIQEPGVEAVSIPVSGEEQGEAPQQSPKQEQIANDLSKPLTPEGEKAKETLVGMGYDGELAHMAINVSGPENLDACIDIIGKIERGEPIPMPKHKKSQEEIEAGIQHYRELLQKKKEAEQQKVAPKVQAVSELERRKQVLENIELKKQLEEKKRQQDLQDAQREKLREKMERDKVRKKIAAQREEAKRAQSGGSAATTTTAATTTATTTTTTTNSAPAAAAQKKAPTECTLKLQFADGSSEVAKFQPEQKLLEVEAWVRHNVATAHGKMIVFETTFPRAVITKEKFSETLLKLQLCPRSQLMVKLV